MIVPSPVTAASRAFSRSDQVLAGPAHDRVDVAGNDLVELRVAIARQTHAELRSIR